jgi:hypothetical protein
MAKQEEALPTKVEMFSLAILVAGIISGKYDMATVNAERAAQCAKAILEPKSKL